MSAHTSPVTSGMGAALQQRLSAQLESLSQVGELLTLRLLELEERLEHLEVQLGQLQPATEPEVGNSAELLAATAERITRLEELLTGGATAMEPPHGETPQLQVVPDPEGEDDGLQEPELELHPFPEEDGEQPFMDELSA
ncbi:MAG: hypothetical protein ACKOCA_03040 [Vulcanococcus sp.]